MPSESLILSYGSQLGQIVVGKLRKASNGCQEVNLEGAVNLAC